MREEVRATVCPAVQTEGFVDRRSGTLAIGLKLNSAGLGPARFERITVRNEDEVVTGIDDLVERMPAGAEPAWRHRRLW